MSDRIDAELLKILVCPKCKGELTAREDGSRHIALECGGCALAYPVEDGIPVMLVEEARSLRDPAQSA